MNEMLLITFVLMALSNLLCFVILKDDVTEIRALLKDIYRLEIKRRTIQEVAEQAEREGRELFPCECDKEEENESQNNA